MKSFLIHLIVLFAIMLPMAQADSADPDATALLKSADRSRGNLQGLAWHVKTTTVKKNGETDTSLELSILSRNADSLIRFTAPARMRGQMMLMRDRNMWFIRPGLRKPVAISPRQRLTGAASNGDIASTNYAGDYQVTHIEEAVWNNVPCYILDLVASTKDVTYDKIKYWISRSDQIGIRSEFYTVSGKRFKEALFKYDNTLVRDGVETPFLSRMVITDLHSDSQTTLSYSDVEIRDIPDSAFNLNLLMH